MGAADTATDPDRPCSTFPAFPDFFWLSVTTVDAPSPDVFVLFATPAFLSSAFTFFVSCRVVFFGTSTFLFEEEPLVSTFFVVVVLPLVLPSFAPVLVATGFLTVVFLVLPVAGLTDVVVFFAPVPVPPSFFFIVSH